MKLTILGTYGTFPPAGGACSGYLIESNNVKLLLDCGTGVLSNLEAHISPREITHVVISHLHPDHFMDLILLRYALTYGYPRTNEKKPVLYLPPGGMRPVKEIMLPFTGATDFFSDEFDVREYYPLELFDLDGMQLHFTLVPHYVPAYAVSVEAGAKLVYSADTGVSSELVEFARDADLFLCEASLLQSTKTPNDTGHVTAAEAGQLASRAGVKKLVLTHVPPYVDRNRSLSEASAVFDGPIEVAREGQTYTLPD